MSENVYIVAVSGGVDSVVLLDALMNPDRRPKIEDRGLLRSSVLDPQSQLVVAHFDHGIRADSASDEAFVRGVAGQYGLPYETERAELGAGVSEAAARQARYDFLRHICKKYDAQLITAHHQDDVIETMLINLIRGTGWRGLTPMAASNHKPEIVNAKQTLNSNNQNPKHSQLPAPSSQILRPLLGFSKQEILAYAQKHNLKWREDSTNTNTNYLRNYLRLRLIPEMVEKDPTALRKLLTINHNASRLKKEIATELQKIITTHHLLPTAHRIPRYQLVMAPPLVAREVVYQALTQLDPGWHPTQQQITRALHFARTGRIGKELVISGQLKAVAQKHMIEFKKYQ